MAAKKKKNGVFRLEDLLVEEVSIVDRPANQRRFLLVKNEVSEMMKGQEIRVDKDGNLTAGETSPKAEVDLVAGFGAIGETIQKQLNLPVDVRDELFRSLSEIMGRVATLRMTTDAAQVDRNGAGNSTLLPVLSQEINDIAKVMGDLSKRISGSAAKKNDPTPEAPAPATEADNETALASIVERLESAVQKRGAKMSKNRLAQFKQAMDTLAKLLHDLEGQPAPAPPTPPTAAQKAVWTTAQINDFPDSAFLYIKPGGKKDSDGKTVPRTNRMFPVRDASGQLDAPHVRNAIARIPQANIPADLKRRLQAQARDLLASMQKADVPAEVAKAMEGLTNTVEKLTGLVQKQGKEIQTLRKARPSSNTIAVEKGAPAQTVEEVSWPLDMNNERNRQTVDKATSFLDS